MNKIGTFNKSANFVEIEDSCWSDTNLDKKFNENNKFTRLKCNNCNNIFFIVISISDYETAAKCSKCGKYFIVHAG